MTGNAQLEKTAEGQLRLSGELTLHNASPVLAQLEAAARQSGSLQLDIRALRHSDSVLLAAILGTARRLQARGDRLSLLGVDERVAGLARVYGIEELITPLLAPAGTAATGS